MKIDKWYRKLSDDSGCVSGCGWYNMDREQRTIKDWDEKACLAKKAMERKADLTARRKRGKTYVEGHLFNDRSVEAGGGKNIGIAVLGG